MKNQLLCPRSKSILCKSKSFNLVILLLITLYFQNVVAESEAQYSISEVEAHSSVEDCWIIVEGFVFDMTKGLKNHEEHTPSLPESCGKDATEAWLTKGIKGEKHKKKSEIKLKTYRIGVVKAD